MLDRSHKVKSSDKVVTFREVFEYYSQIEFDVYFEEYKQRECSLMRLQVVRYYPTEKGRDQILADIGYIADENGYKCTVNMS